MNNDEAVKILMPEEFGDEMEILTTVFTPENEIGLVIAGENMYQTSENPVIRIFMLENVDLGWALNEELQAFAFLNYDEAQSFLVNLPNMSALELLIIMNGQEPAKQPAVGYLS